VSGSALHLAVSNLTAIFAAVDIDDIEVVDGPNEDPRAAMLLEVGWAGDTSAASVVRARLDRAAARSAESIDVRCLLSFHDDRLTVAATRLILTDAFDLLDAAVRALALNRSSSAPLLLAEITEYDYFPAQNAVGGVGATASIAFTVNVTGVK
jgi:hypothetical protein